MLIEKPRPEDWPVHPAALADEALLALCDLGRGRSGGPGGQHRNKVQTLVVLTHRESGVSAQAGERRSAQENQRVALRRLRLALATEVRVGVPLGECRTALWKSRTGKAGGGKGRISCSPSHKDYPSMLAEAMDVLEAALWDVETAALRLVVSKTQLVRLIADHPAAMSKMNAERVRRGKRALK